MEMCIRDSHKQGRNDSKILRYVIGDRESSQRTTCLLYTSKSMSTPIVEVKHLSHRYSVDWAIRDINFSIEKTGILGLLGSNGCLLYTS